LLYLLTLLFYFIIFFFLFFIYQKTFETLRRKKKISNLEHNLIWSIPKYLKVAFTISPSFTKNFLFKYKNKLLEQELIYLLNELIPSCEGGISCFETLENISKDIAQPLKNELNFFLIYSKKYSIKKSLEYKINKSTNIFLKQFWQTLYRYLLSGGLISKNLSLLKKSIILKTNTRKKIKARLLNNKIQLILSIIVPYFMFLAVSLIMPDIFINLINSKLGIYILLISIIMHLIGVLIFIKISKFDCDFDFKKAIFINYIAFSLENGFSFYEAFNEVYYLLNINSSDLSKTRSNYDLLDLLLKIKDSDIKNFSKILRKNIEYGISSSKSLNNLYIHIMEKIEHNIAVFEQKLPSLSLIPLFLFIFPATYSLILSPILVELFK
jgi:hypothetical protein